MPLFGIFYLVGCIIAFCIMMYNLLGDAYEVREPDYVEITLAFAASLISAIWSWAFVGFVLAIVFIKAFLKFFNGGGYQELKENLYERVEKYKAKRKMERMYSNSI